MQILLPFGLLSVLVFAVVGYFRNTIILNWHIFPILLLYPIWGTIQQFIIVGLVAGNLQDMQKYKLPEWVIIGITAIIFAIVHYPSMLLIIGTFLLCLIYTKIYLWKRNLYVLGLFHGWLGALFYFFVLNRDPWIEVFEQLIN